MTVRPEVRRALAAAMAVLLAADAIAIHDILSHRRGDASTPEHAIERALKDLDRYDLPNLCRDFTPQTLDTPDAPPQLSAVTSCDDPFLAWVEEHFEAVRKGDRVVCMKVDVRGDSAKVRLTVKDDPITRTAPITKVIGLSHSKNEWLLRNNPEATSPPPGPRGQPPAC